MALVLSWLGDLWLYTMYYFAVNNVSQSCMCTEWIPLWVYTSWLWVWIFAQVSVGLHALRVFVSISFGHSSHNLACSLVGLIFRNWECMSLCLAMDCDPIQGVPCLIASGSCHRLQHHYNPIDIMDISKMHWTGNGFINSGEYTAYYSGDETTRR